MEEGGSKTNMLLCYFAGACFSTGWWIWIDAVTYSATILDKTITFGIWSPGFVSTIALILVNLVPRSALDRQLAWGWDSGSEVARARAFLFFAFTVAFGGIISSVWIAIVNWFTNSDAETAFPGIALILQSGFIFL
eukprot:TRINITY_DN2513_c0_g1_i4.p1 TRINITY_DN2513_c0_g1~~TRINITY_DN2513_c0_g1_i4.p1  ORF type:complete len:136 (-),score=10.68 TRINITY_DN2513_c0_g1_i4:24-431(-)